MLVVGLGPGDPESVPAAAVEALRGAARVVCVQDLSPAVLAVLPASPGRVAWDGCAEGDVVAATDPVAQRLAREHPAAATVPARDVLRARAIGAAVAELAAVGARLRRDCPWDAAQVDATIVPHTIEEAFEVAEAVAAGDDAREADEVGDLLFQAVFLAQLLEERGPFDLGAVAAGQADKLVRRHPHVYGDERAADTAGVLDIWERQKRAERPDQGIFHDLPVGLPALAFAAKAQRRAAAAGFDAPDLAAALAKLDEEVAELRADESGEEIGDVLFAAIAAARHAGVEPELALRRAAQRFRARVEGAAERARAEGVEFAAAPLQDKARWYREAKSRLGEAGRVGPTEPLPATEPA